MKLYHFYSHKHCFNAIAIAESFDEAHELIIASKYRLGSFSRIGKTEFKQMLNACECSMKQFNGTIGLFMQGECEA